jgi:pyocin large subunit-like protein
MKNIKKYGSLILITLIILISFVITNMGSNDNESNSSDTSSKVESNVDNVSEESLGQTYCFRNDNLLTQHFQKHGNEFSYSTKEEYEAGASAVINNPKALHKTESKDGDDVYYVEDTNEFVVLSTDGYIRTYFKPSGGKSYYDRK